MSTATAADEFKEQFYLAVKDLMAEEEATKYVHVTYGQPDTLDPEDIVSFMALESQQDPKTIGNRGREEVIVLDVQISCFRGGGQESELLCAKRGYELLRMIEYYCRKTDTTVGGTVMWCFLTSHESFGATDPQHMDKGRVIEITAKFTARSRIH
jgi:hypothetical protein